MISRFQPEIRRFLVAGGFLAVILSSQLQSASAEDWMFRRSYYSHDFPNGLPADYPQPVNRSAYRIAHYRDGFGVNSGYRINNYVIQNGNRIDRTYYREGWIEFVPPGE